MSNKPTIAYIIITISILIIVVLFLNNNSNNKESSPKDWVLPEEDNITTTELSTTSSEDISITANETYATFTNDQLGISFQYPTTYKAKTKLEID